MIQPLMSSKPKITLKMDTTQEGICAKDMNNTAEDPTTPKKRIGKDASLTFFTCMCARAYQGLTR